MQALSQSAFLQALGYAIANSLWQTALLWLLAAAFNSFVKAPSHVKYKVALTAQFSAFIWFMVTLQFYYEKCSEAIARLNYSGIANGNALVLHPGMRSFISALLLVILKGEMLLPYLSIAYLCLLVAMAVRWVKGYRETRLIKTTGLQKIDVEWRLFVKKIADLIGVKKRVHIYISQLVKSPMTIGFLKPIILVPIASINNLTTYQLEAILLHELAHIKRGDYLINIVQSIIETALFFNPFTQLLSKMIRRERENSCDDWVLQFQYEPSRYAEALLRIAYLQQSPSLAMNAASKETDLLWRVKRMLNQKERSFEYRNRLVALLMITGILTSVAWLHPDVKAEAAKPVASTQPVVEEPMAARIDNQWFNPVSFLNKPLRAEVDKAVADAKADLQVTSRIALDKTGEALEKITPAAMEGLKQVNIDIPQLVSTATNSASTALENVNLSNDININLKGLKDSLNVSNLVKLAFSNGFKNIDLKDLNSGLAISQQQLNKVLADKGLQEGTSGYKINQTISKAIKEATNTIFKVNVEKGDDNNDDGDEGAATISSTGGITLKGAVNTKAQAKKIQRKLLSLNRIKSDSSNRVFNRLQLSRARGAELYTAISKQFDLMADSASGYKTGSVNGYGITNYVPVKYNEDLPYNLSVGTANNVTVTSKGSSALIAVKEEDDSVESYKKRITIETLDSTGQKHVFHVTFEMYQ
jgi:beta-lactamase regulating signal transducer with metallopeptidase domain